MAESPDTRIVTAIKHEAIFLSDAVTSNTVPLARIPPLSRSTPLQMQGWGGLQEDPEDGRQVEMYIRDVDVDNIPDQTSMRNRHWWGAIQRWQHVGTAGNAVQTMQRYAHISVGGFVANNEPIDERRRNYQWILRLIANSSVSVAFIGTFTHMIEYVVRTWRNDAYTYNDDPGDKNSEGLSEIDFDQASY